ncbi:MAG: SDR family NAD(P)-dependent oxidoreductase [Planctomycetes bacterium]|nr:SDR family NAD(P)-dependent oxidoreductase [Planctomycetota bacterium]
MADRDEAIDLHGLDIAVIGMAARLPRARTVGEFWRNLRDGVEAVAFHTEEQLRANGATEAMLRHPDFVNADNLLEDVEQFDAGFFQFSPMDAAIMDPQHRHFLEVCWEALENAGHTPESCGGSIGVFGGSGMNAYMPFNLFTNPAIMNSIGLFLVRHTGNDKDFLTTRVSYCLNLKGPSVNVQTACSTSLVAIHLAAQSLLSHECELALAGGVTIIVPHGQGYIYKEGEVLSPDGRCRAFDARSKGTAFGSGAGVVVLRRLADAIAAGDHIHAVIRGSAVNNDGSMKVGYLAPSVDGQANAIAEAIAVAGVDPDTITYVEAHGTGTPVGDPIEIAALTKAFRAGTDRKGFCHIGSLKTNIGHLDTAAGVAGFIKVVEALKHREIPPSLNFEVPNPAIDFASSPFVVNSKLRPWEVPKGMPRRAGLSSLGVGGTNAHVIIEEAPPARASSPARPWKLLVLSARSRAALEKGTARLGEHLEANSGIELGDVAYTLMVGRRAMAARRAIVASDAADAAAVLKSGDAKRCFTRSQTLKDPMPAFMFPGGGAAYPGMGRDLYEREKPYREAVDQCASILRPLIGSDIRDLLYPAPERMEDASKRFGGAMQLTALFVTEYALAKLLMSWGIAPAAMIGHSLGEYPAACLAGVFTLADVLALVVMRGNLLERVERGGMLSVNMAAEELAAIMPKELSIAAVNAPALCAASGRAPAIEELERLLAARGVEFRRIHISIAGHSPLIDPILGDFEACLRRLVLSPPQLPYVSCLNGGWVQGDEVTSPEYWVNHLRRTVQFSRGISTMLARKDFLLIEVGPGNTLATLARMHGEAGSGRPILQAIRHHDEHVDDQRFLLGMLGQYWIAGGSFDAEKLHAAERRVRVPLPTYPFEHQRFWIEPGKSHFAEAAAAGAGGAGAAPALARIARTDDWFSRPVWRKSERGAAGTAGAAPPEKERWLVFLDGAGVGRRLAGELARAGHEVVLVAEGDAYYRLGDREYVIVAEDKASYESLVEDLVASGRCPNRILHLWLVTAKESFRPGSSFFHRNQERGFYSLLYLCQSLGYEQLKEGTRLYVVTNGVQQVGAEAVPYPEKATALGPVKVIPREYPGVTCQAIDVDLAAIDATIAPLAESFRVPIAAGDEIAAYRGAERFALAYEPLAVPEAAARAKPLRDRGTYLITGGLGGIGYSIAEHMAKEARVRLVLAGRSALPPRGEWDAYLRSHAPSDRASAAIRRVRRLEQLGAEVLVGAADVANIEEMKRVLDDAHRRFGAIHGAVHAAGTIADGVIQEKTHADVERIFTPKVHGTQLLYSLLAGDELDFFVLFSSTSTALGYAGQVDYVAANWFLNAFAQSRSREQKPYVVAVNWGIWQEVGMAAAISHRMGSGAAAAGGAQDAEPVAHPLLHTCVERSDERVVYHAEYSPRALWILDQHRIKDGRAVVPGTGYLEIARAAMETARNGTGGGDGGGDGGGGGGAPAESAGKRRILEVGDLVFLSPLEVEDDGSREVRVTLERSGDAYTFAVASRILSGSGAGAGGAGRWEEHAEGRVLERDQDGGVKLDLAEIKARFAAAKVVEDRGGIRTGQEQHLRFGERWRNLKRVVYGQREALALLELPREFANELEEYALHPALLDLATGFALPLIDGYSPERTLYVPFSYGKVRVHAPLTRRIYSHIKGRPENHASREVALFDAVIADETGRVLVEVENFTVKKLGSAEGFAAAGSPAARRGARTTTHAAATGTLSDEERLFLDTLALGIRPEEGSALLERVLGARPGPQVIISSIEVAALRAQSDAIRHVPAADGARFARPELESAYVEPRNEIERTLVGFWQELLGVERIGIKDSFFDLGGYSLLAVRLFGRIKKSFNVDYPISMLFEAPSIEQLAALIREEVGGSEVEAAGAEEGAAPRKKQTRRFKHLVQIQAGDPAKKPPFFLVAGMFGNIMNLRHLAGHIGDDQPYFGVQAKGLLGDEPPHNRFEDMARDYIAEIRMLQPHGPYFLGGFSGGGLTAYEIMRQLREAGEAVALLAMLDTPAERFPYKLTRWDRVRIHWWRLRKGKAAYIKNWARDRFGWELARLRRKRHAEENTLHPAEYRSEVIGNAFVEAVDAYRPAPYAGKLTLFRPRLDAAYELGGGRVANESREFVDHHNFWKRYVTGEVEVHEVPGDHDSMVLEPNVRVLGSQLRACLERAQAAPRAAAAPPPSAPITPAPQTSAATTATAAAISTDGQHVL